ncbi:site-specific integrase [Streptacidiphilus sp. MAP12-33]|uniref:site-specific integrase n=1 Tax=Streptacidiphilus sp. MAP12-33 TaxID=3156266 RepID=UPI00351221C5
MRAGDPIFVGPDYRIDPVLLGYGSSRAFRGLAVETRRNYATDLTLLLTFLWSRERRWLDARSRDLEDFEDWRLRDPENPGRVGESKADRELAAFSGLFRWAVDQGHVTVDPVSLMQGVGRRRRSRGMTARSGAGGMHWLTPRSWRLWTDVGLRGHTGAGVPETGWGGRLEDRNVAFARLVVSSGLRRQEAGSLLTFEVPRMPHSGGRYCRGRVAAEVTRAKAARMFYAATGSVRDIESYVESSRAWAVAKAQANGKYDQLPGLRLVTEVTHGPRPRVRWLDGLGRSFEQPLDRLTWQERTLLFTEGPAGPEPMWLWLNEAGLPLHPHSWEAVFRAANQRCRLVLAPPQDAGRDPFRVWAPYATVHAGRHSFALFMLVVLNWLLDRRYGLSPAERRDFRLLYGDPWHMVQALLGHATRQVTIDTYLAPVRHLQLDSLLADAPPSAAEPVGDLDALFARVARETEGIQDIEARMAGAR